MAVGQKFLALKRVKALGNKIKPICLFLWSVCLYIGTRLVLLNPIIYLRRKEQALYGVDQEGKIPFKPRTKERIFNLFSSEIKRKRYILSWIKTRIPGRQVEDFTTSWQDGISLCALLQSVLPGSCPGFHNLKTHNRVNNCRLGIKLAQQHMQLPHEMITPEEMAIADTRTEKKIFKFLSLLKWASETKIKQGINITGLNANTDQAFCNVQGSGLKAGVAGRKMKFTVNISNVFDTFDLFLQIKGPRNEVYSEKIVSLHQSSDAILSNKKRVLKRVSSDGKSPQGDTKVMAYLEDGQGNTYVRWKNTVQYGAHAVYNALDFNCTCSKEGSFLMSFTPASPGIHTVSIRWQDNHVEGSPFKVKVYKLSDVSRRSLLETHDKRILFDSLSMSFDSHNSSDQSQCDKQKQIQTTQNVIIPEQIQQRMRKQYTITKRRILKKVIARNDEEIIISETPSPSSYSRQSSTTDMSDYTDEDRGSISRSSSPAILKVAKDVTTIWKQRCNSQGSSKMKKEPRMASIYEASSHSTDNFLVPEMNRNSSRHLSFKSESESDSLYSLESGHNDQFINAITSNKISKKFLESCFQRLAKQNFGLRRYGSHDEILQSKVLQENDDQRNKTQRDLTFSRSMSESSLMKHKILENSLCSIETSNLDKVQKGNESSMACGGKVVDSISTQTAVSTQDMPGSQSKEHLSSGDSNERSAKVVDNPKLTLISDEFSDFNKSQRRACNSKIMEGKDDHTKGKQVNIIKDTDTVVKIDVNHWLDNNDKEYNQHHDNYGERNTSDKHNGHQNDIVDTNPNDGGHFKTGLCEKSRGLHNGVSNIGEYKKDSISKKITLKENFPIDGYKKRDHNRYYPSRKLSLDDIGKSETGKEVVYRTMSSESKRGKMLKQLSFYQNDSDEETMDETTDSIGSFDKSKDSKNKSLEDSCKAVTFRTINNNAYEHPHQHLPEIMVPKVTCDKGTSVTVNEIINETNWNPVLHAYKVLRRRFCLGTEVAQNETDHTEETNAVDIADLVTEENIFNRSRSMSADCSRDGKVRAWIAKHPSIRFNAPIRQSTIETTDSGVGDDNGIISTRRSSLYSHFRFSGDNNHKALHRRPYRGSIPLDPRLTQPESTEPDDKQDYEQIKTFVETTTANNDYEDNNIEHENNYNDEIVAYKNMKNINMEIQNRLNNNDVFPSKDGMEIRTEMTHLDVLPDLNRIRERHPSRTDSNCDSQHTLTTHVSRTVSTSSSVSIDELYCGFGLNKNKRADLLNHINDFQHLRSNSNERPMDVFFDSSSSVSPPQSDTSNLTNTSCDFSEAEASPEGLRNSYVTTIEVPRFMQMNDVIVKQNGHDFLHPVDISENGDSTTFISEYSNGNDVCTADGSGLQMGQVGIKNNFQVWTNDPHNGSLSVTIYGPKSHSVLETCVVYTGDNLYEVIYEVKHPGIYIICVKWSEENIPNSPFTCRVTY